MSVTGALALLAVVTRAARSGAQFVIATHSPILMAYPHAAIFQMSEDGPFEIPYRETEHFMVTRRFLNDPEAMLEIVLNRDIYGD